MRRFILGKLKMGEKGHIKDSLKGIRQMGGQSHDDMMATNVRSQHGGILGERLGKMAYI